MFESRDDVGYYRSQKIVYDECEPFEPDTKRMLAVHPHGTFTAGWGLLSVHKSLQPSKVHWLATESLFFLPFISDFLAALRCESVSKENMTRLMSKERNVALIPGGFEEATVYAHGKHRIFLKNRKGFIKMALVHGYTIHPVYCFGEEFCYWSFTPFLKLRMALNRYKIPGIICIGKYGMLPNDDVDMRVVVGKGFECPKIEKPTTEQVADYHQKYMDHLMKLFDKHKEQYAPGATLEVF